MGLLFIYFIRFMATVSLKDWGHQLSGGYSEKGIAGHSPPGALFMTTFFACAFALGEFYC